MSKLFDKRGKRVASPKHVNQQMLEIKKKIQLSEGQRKATFEECILLRKQNTAEIANLKKEIGNLIGQANDLRSSSVALKKIQKRLEATVGPTLEKSTEEITRSLDLQIVDKNKALNLLDYKILRKQRHLATLGTQYRALLAEETLYDVIVKIDRPLTRATCNLQNQIHAVEVQFREANHVTARYRAIEKKLREDGATFEGNIARIEEALAAQAHDVARLQAVLEEASRMKAHSRALLHKEEKVATTSARHRDKQTVDGRRLVVSRKQELEFLERRIFQRQQRQRKMSTSVEAAAQVQEQAETPTDNVQPTDPLSESLAILKRCTGAPDSAQLLRRFTAQTDTFDRLVALRHHTETEKRQLERQVDSLGARSEQLKAEQARRTRKKSQHLELLKQLIGENNGRGATARTLRDEKFAILTKVAMLTSNLATYVSPTFVSAGAILDDLRVMGEQVGAIFDSRVLKPEVGEEVEGEMWLPGFYSGLVTRTPMPAQASGGSPAPGGSEEGEEEVPSRTYLKRQAQIVVDAKVRRKNIIRPPRN